MLTWLLLVIHLHNEPFFIVHVHFGHVNHFYIKANEWSKSRRGKCEGTKCVKWTTSPGFHTKSTLEALFISSNDPWNNLEYICTVWRKFSNETTFRYTNNHIFGFYTLTLAFLDVRYKEEKLKNHWNTCCRLQYLQTRVSGGTCFTIASPWSDKHLVRCPFNALENVKMWSALTSTR